MSDGERYVSSIKNMDVAMKRLNSEVKKLRLKKAETQGHLYKWMKRNGYDNYEGYSINKITPKPAIKRKPLKQKREDAFRFFRDAGISDPETFWAEFEKTQKNIPDNSGDENF